MTTRLLRLSLSIIPLSLLGIAVAAFDVEILNFLAAPYGRYPAFDMGVGFLAASQLAKGIPFMMLFWWLWFARPQSVRAHAILLSLIAVSLLAVALGRGLQNFLPNRPRPVQDLLLYASSSLPDGIQDWSSMPSDHAVLFFSLATGFLIVHRAAGSIALLYAGFVVCLPRLYLGLHYPSDIFVGAVIGVVLIYIFVPPISRFLLRCGRMTSLEDHASITYPLLFFATFQIASMLNPLRQVVVGVGKILGAG
jgi:undecaprenyl-diphosphatase